MSSAPEPDAASDDAPPKDAAAARPGRDGPGFYDDPQVFATYMRHREGAASPNETLELPAFLALLGDPRGHDFLDLGCGDGRFGRRLLTDGAASYTGVDGSRNMAQAARASLAGTTGRVVEANLEAWTFPVASHSRVCARLVLHYLDDLQGLLRRAAGALRPGGRLVFSVEHPIITSCAATLENASVRHGWIVDDYFQSGPRLTPWMGAQVRKFHRSVEDYFAAVQAAGLRVDGLCEARPDRAVIGNEVLYRSRQRLPLYLLMAAVQPASPG